MKTANSASVIVTLTLLGLLPPLASRSRSTARDPPDPVTAPLCFESDPPARGFLRFERLKRLGFFSSFFSSAGAAGGAAPASTARAPIGTDWYVTFEWNRASRVAEAPDLSCAI